MASVAYPSYTEYVVRSHRQAAKNMLYQIADRQEQFFLDNRTYAANLTALGYGADNIGVNNDGQMVAADDANRTYVFQIAAQTPTTYTIQTTPQLVQAARDTKCGNLSLLSTGEQQEENANVDDCW
ncbi:MAG: pilus assembly protein PilE [Gammaproteobacteria bacterium]|nr:pilus assembly protein PilE [Gammaproteobacteria bacterium]